MNLLLLFLPVFTNACLKINQLAPPPCGCNVLAIDPADVYNYEPKNSNFWANKPQSLLRKPIQVVDDCSVKMYCDGEAKLFIFDKTSVREFGEYSAEGFCDPYTQKISVDLNAQLTTITNLYGICVLGTDRCACQSVAIQPSNIFQNIPRGHPYFRNVTLNVINIPVIKYEDCAISMYCFGDYKLLVFDPVVGQSAHNFGNLSVNGSCDAGTQTWSITDGSGKHWSFNQFNAVCVKNSRCPCASLEMRIGISEYYLGQDSFYQDFVKINDHSSADVTLSADGCQLTRGCDEDSELIIYWSRSDDPEYTLQMEHGSISDESTCDPKTGTWALNGGSTVRNAELFATTCLYHGICYACQYIVDTEFIIDHIPSYDPLFKTLTLITVKRPTLQMKDCVYTMSCESDYSLMVLDRAPVVGDQRSYTFGSKPVNGACDKISKYWSVDDGNGKTANIFRMYGICLKNSKCPCPSLELSSSTAKYYLRDRDTPVLKYNTTPAIKTLSADGCQYMRSCSDGAEPLTYYIPLDKPDDKPHPISTSISGGSTCNPATGVWTLREGSTVIETEFFAPMCIYWDLPIGQIG